MATNKLKNFSEGKIKIHNGEPVIAFKFTGKEPIWAIRKEADKKIKLLKALKAKITPLIEEATALKNDIVNAKEEFWKDFMDMFDEDSQTQLDKFDQEVSPDELEIYCIKENEDFDDKMAKIVARAKSGEFGDVGEPAGGFVLKESWSKAEARVHIREKMLKMLPDEMKPELENIVDKITADIYENDKPKNGGGFSISLDGEVKRVI